MKAVHPFKLAALAVLLTATFAASDVDAQRKRGGDEPVALYPDATRDPPKASYTQRLTRQHKKLQEIYTEEGREQEALALAEEILNHERANAYDKAVAAMTAGTVAVAMDDEARGMAYFERAIAEDALPNDNHYNVMVNLAALQINAEQYDKADPLLARVIAETSTKNPDIYAMQASSFYNNGKFAEAVQALERATEVRGEAKPEWTRMQLAAYDELGEGDKAIALGEKLLAKDPDDKSAISNLALLYSNNDQAEKAAALLDGARKRGLMTEARDYDRILSVYYNLDQQDQVAAVIEEGFAKGILPNDGRYNAMLAQAHYFSDNIPAAIAAAGKAAELSKEGEPGLFLAQVLSQEDRNAEALAAAKAAIAKGLKSPGSAWMVVARSEYYSDNMAAAKAAYREAAKDPATRDQAQKALSQLTR